MLFSSITFLYLFLPTVLLLYFVMPKGGRNYLLLAASLFFYFFGEPVYTVLLIFSSLSDYLHSLVIEKCRGTAKAKVILTSSIIINLAMLGFFKYADFLIGAVNSWTGAAIPLLNIPLPIGISFFTFQTMSYTIDVYRGRVHAQRNLATLATYVCLFPQLIAGPIVRYSDVAAELQERTATFADVSLGIRRFVLGLGKKVLIANTMGELCVIFRDGDDKSVAFFWLYALAFSLQIYFDFSGYSDMAIGLGRMFGFKFPENFNYPFISRSITDFWRRWHITLGSWFRDYLYIPLGGNRVSTIKWLRNIVIVWLLTGLWHGAAWNFVLWGAFFGLFLVLEKLWIGKLLARAGRVLPHLYVLLLVLVSFVIFNADGLSGVIGDLGGMFGLGGYPLGSAQTLYYFKSYGLLLAVAIFGSTPALKMLVSKVQTTALGSKILMVLEPLFLITLLIIVTAFLVDGSFNPFLYFRF